jgi:putative hemolysin
VADTPALSDTPDSRPETLTSGLEWPVRPLVEALPGVAALNRLYLQSHGHHDVGFPDRALATLGVTVDARGAVDAIPASGPVVVVANHPTGALDGLVLLSLVARRRPDVKLLANHWLGHVGALRDELILVDAFGDPRRSSLRALRDAVRRLRAGGALCVFPSGTVSHLHLRSGAVIDPSWRDGVARLVRLTGSAVVPCFIEGRNSQLFQLAGLIHPWLRTALLPRELLRRRGARIVVHVGEAIQPRVPDGADDAAVTRRLRGAVYALPLARPQGMPDAARDTAADVAREVASLDRSQTLAETREYSVFHFRAAQAPRLLGAIGRAREAAFRSAGEGTGCDVDLDRFDADYVHLCLWDKDAQALAGAYRMRPVAAGLHPADLYTHTLFDFDQRLVRTLAPALELGRAFVAPSHQKRHAPLLLLWTGIAKYVAAHPEIRHLFGAVSIGASYSPAARAFMAAYLRRHALDRLRAPLVSPRHPLGPIGPEAEGGETPGAMDPQAFSASVQSLDEERKGLPVLLRQYLKLHARVLDFSVDPGFGHVLDVLVAIDLPAAPRALLKRYMGDAEADAYLAHHHRSAAAAGDPRKTA